MMDKEIKEIKEIKSSELKSELKKVVTVGAANCVAEMLLALSNCLFKFANNIDKKE